MASITVTCTPTKSLRAGTPTPSTADIWRWTLTQEARAPCFVQDVLTMREEEGRELDFFWLGRIPCRTVRLVGMIVGVQVYEKRTVYTIDDGTAVIDCVLRYQTTAHSHPSSKGKSKATVVDFGDVFTAGSAEPPEPAVHVGQTTRIEGRVITVRRDNTRMVLVDDIDPCASANDEPAHWIAVVDLHRTSYFATDAGPFTVPTASASASARERMARLTMLTEDAYGVLNVGAAEPRTPSTSGRSSVATTPESAASSSSARSLRQRQSPPRLRHPSRLHSRDLTVITFRIYVKHYMDNVPSLAARQLQLDQSDSEVDDGYETPSKGEKRGVDLTTPRPPRQLDIGRTPRQAKAVNTRQTRSQLYRNDGLDKSAIEEEMKGYTLSHLRRVPELAALARRVVHAEAKRRAREDRRRAKDESAKTQAQDKGKVKASKTELKSSEPARAKMKRLFLVAIRQLYEEGAIVLWDGPVRDPPAPSLFDSSVLWRTQTIADTSTTTTSSSTAGSSMSMMSSLVEEWEEGDGYVSDAPSGEEAYVPLMPAYLAPVVERAIADMMARASSSSSSSLSGVQVGNVPPAGPTAAEITAHLQRRDARWARVGEWAVKEALEWGKVRGKVWCVGGGRWERCL